MKNTNKTKKIKYKLYRLCKRCQKKCNFNIRPMATNYGTGGLLLMEKCLLEFITNGATIKFFIKHGVLHFIPL